MLIKCVSILYYADILLIFTNFKRYLWCIIFFINIFSGLISGPSTPQTIKVQSFILSDQNNYQIYLILWSFNVMDIHWQLIPHHFHIFKIILLNSTKICLIIFFSWRWSFCFLFLFVCLFWGFFVWFLVVFYLVFFFGGGGGFEIWSYFLN